MQSLQSQRTIKLATLLFMLFLTSASFAQQFDARLEKTTITAGAVRYGVDIPYNLTIHNDGTDSIQNITLRDLVSDGYEFVAADNPGWMVDPTNPNAVITTYTGKIRPGGSQIVTLLLRVQPTADPTNWDNVAEIVSYTDVNGTDQTAQDNNPANNTDDSSVQIVDVALTKELLTTGTIAYGDTLTFRNTIYNQGNVDLGEVTIKDLIPEGYSNPVDVNVLLGWSMAAVNPQYIFPTVPVGAVLTVDFRLVLTMEMANGNAWDNYAEVSLIKNFDNTNIFFVDADSNPNSNTAAERTIRQGDPDDNYIGNMPINPGFQDDHDPASPIIYDLAIRKERLTGPPSYSYGQGITYSIDIFNQGNMPVQDVIFKDSLPCGIEDLDVTNNPGWTYDAATRIATFVYNDTILPATFERFILNLEVRPCYEGQYSAWTNVTEIFEARDFDGNIIVDIDSQYDDIFTNDPGGVPGSPTDNILTGNGVEDEDDHDVEAIEIVDLALRKTVLTDGPYAEGDTIDFNIRVFNQGNVEATEVFIQEFIPEGYRYEQSINGPLGWSRPVQVGITSIDSLANTIPNPILAGDSTDVLIRLILELDGTEDRDWYNYAHVLISRDSLGNNRFDDADSQPLALSPEEFLIIPGGVDDDNIFTLGENAGQDQDDHDPAGIRFFDLSVEKLGGEGQLFADQEIDFAITVTNEGNVATSTVELTEYIPCGYRFEPNLNVANQMWTLDPATGYATTILTNPIPPGEFEITVITLIVERCTEPGAYRNSVEISAATDVDGNTPDDQDSTPDDDPTNDLPDEDDTDSTQGGIIDLSLTKSFATPPIAFGVGGILDYVISVTNEGTLAASNVQVVDYVPCGLTFIGSTGWVNNGGEVTYTIPGLVQPGQTIDIPLQLSIAECGAGETPDYTNVAEISNIDLEDGTPVTFDYDSQPDNDPTNDPVGEDDIDDQPLEIFDLSLSKQLVDNGPYQYGDVLEYEILITNEGSVEATSYTVTEYLQCGLTFDPALNTGWAINPINGHAELAINNSLMVGEDATYSIFLTLGPCSDPAAPFAWFNIAEISSATDPDGPADDQDSTPDDDPTNDLPGEDDTDSVPFDVYDLSLQKTVIDQQPMYEVGETVEYQMTITNEGNVGADGYSITDRLPCNLTLAPGATAWTTNADGSVTLVVSTTILPGFSATHTLLATVVECDDSTNPTVNIAEITNVISGTDDPFDDFDSTPDNQDPTEDDQDSAEIITPPQTAIIGDFVFEDIDGDGIQDANEPGIPNVTVTIFDDSQNEVTTVTTDPNGFYEVELEEGDYYIVFGVADDYEPTLPLVGSTGNDSNVTGDFAPTSTSLFTVVAGEDDNTIDAGFYRCVLIEGIAWYDINENDTRQGFENGINGLTVNLYRNVQGTFVLWDTGLTQHDEDTPSDDGLWTFCVAPGNYYVEVVMPLLGLVRVRPFRGSINIDSDINNANGLNTTPSFTLQSGQSKTDLGAGYYPMATVSSRVWLDENVNGLQDENEPSVANVQVEVYDAANELVETTTSDDDGELVFEYLRKESYYLKFAAPDGYGFTNYVAGEEEINSDVNHANGQNTTALMSLEPGMDLFNIDAGLSSGLLPLTWVSVTAKARERDNQLLWITESELNTSHFEIEKSIDEGKTFSAVGQVKSQGLSEQVRYTFEDRNVQEGVAYYRINQIDNDGANAYSPVVSVVRKEENTVSLYPNPTRDLINISGVSESAMLYIFDAVGQLVLQAKIGDTEHYSIDISQLPDGVYSYTISASEGNTKTGKLIKI